jgi:tRNA threonylcarbamoyladenosine biosynthesis protein TsaE
VSARSGLISRRHELADAEATHALGRELAKSLKDGGLVFLYGDLGAGKTTLVRGIMDALGWQGAVRSPSYALVHSYPMQPLVHHLDLYRMGSFDEALSLDLDALFAPGNVSLVEWPEVLGDQFAPDVKVELAIDDAGLGRIATISSVSRT